VIDAAKNALDYYGLGASGSPILSGNYQIGLDFEAQVARFKRKEAALVFQTGYATNLGFISSIMRPGDTIILDQFAHASIVDGAILSRAHISYFKHNDIHDLEKKLIKAKGKKLVVVEGVYSMDGDFCPLADIVILSKKYGARILLDEAHSAFIYGENGRGIAELLDLEDQIDYHMGTFSKSLGGIGGYICASAEVINYVTAYARSRFFSCNLPPAVVAGLSKALEIAIAEPQLRDKLAHNVAMMKEQLGKYNIDTSHSQSQIIPLIIGNESKTFRIAKKILNEGVFVLPIVYPAVTKNKGRLRISISATLDDTQIERATSIIAHAIQSE
jgi:glycine C-acetyltransferase